MTELATTMITTGFGAQLGALPVDADAAQLTEFIVKAGTINVSEQLTEMAIGIRQQFDLAGVALAMGSAGLNSKIKLDNPLERRLAADVGVAAMSGVVRGRFDVENLAMQMMTDTAGYLAQRQPQSVSDDYQSSQKASRGGKALSPWESELINDAQFTANTPLPSVTLDVNDDFLAQRVGEEVSHFYHPTLPPRNPSGFWQRYENVFEHRALIAEGRAAANSEVIRESLENATANQQNDLDLGYTESAAQTRAGWIGISEIPAPQLIRTGIQTTQFLAENKWGFFGRKGTESVVKVIESTIKSLAENPFKGKTFEEIDKILTSRGYKKIGPDPANGKGSYFHPETGRKYYLDNGGVYKEGVELPHVDVHRMKDGLNLEKVGKRRFPIGDNLIEENVNTRGYNANF